MLGGGYTFFSSILALVIDKTSDCCDQTKTTIKGTLIPSFIDIHDNRKDSSEIKLKMWCCIKPLKFSSNGTFKILKI